MYSLFKKEPMMQEQEPTTQEIVISNFYRYFPILLIIENSVLLIFCLIYKLSQNPPEIRLGVPQVEIEIENVPLMRR